MRIFIKHKIVAFKNRDHTLLATKTVFSLFSVDISAYFSSDKLYITDFFMFSKDISVMMEILGLILKNG